MADRGALTPKQQVFVEEYLVDLNATQAAIRAGYSKKTAKQQGARLLTNVDIAAAVQAALAARSERTEISQNMVLDELAKVAFANLGDYLVIADDGLVSIDFSKLPEGGTAVLAELTQSHVVGGTEGQPVLRTKFKLHSKLTALELLGRHLGLFPNRHEHGATGGGPVEFIMKYPDGYG